MLMIAVKGLYYSYPDGTDALRNINLSIKKSDTAAIIGRNGAGKTTLLLHFNGLLMPQKGEIIVDKFPLVKENLKFIRRMVGIVFQNPEDMLFSPTVYDDIAFGLRNLGLTEDEITFRVNNALSEVGMRGFENKNPHHLSLGQKKRISIAAVIAMRPRVIIFDEPLSHLDPPGRKEVMKLILGLDCTKIIATNDFSILKHCNKVIMLDDGKTVYSGKKAKKETLKKYGLL
jgi:cobalt/nickel transport system ATP-binding protein